MEEEIGHHQHDGRHAQNPTQKVLAHRDLHEFQCPMMLNSSPVLQRTAPNLRVGRMLAQVLAATPAVLCPLSTNPRAGRWAPATISAPSESQSARATVQLVRERHDVTVSIHVRAVRRATLGYLKDRIANLFQSTRAP